MSLIFSLNPVDGKKASNVDFGLLSVEGRIKTGKIIELLRYRKTEEGTKKKRMPTSTY